MSDVISHKLKPNTLKTRRTQILEPNWNRYTEWRDLVNDQYDIWPDLWKLRARAGIIAHLSPFVLSISIKEGFTYPPQYVIQVNDIVRCNDSFEQCVRYLDGFADGHSIDCDRMRQFTGLGKPRRKSVSGRDDS